MNIRIKIKALWTLFKGPSKGPSVDMCVISFACVS